MTNEENNGYIIPQQLTAKLRDLSERAMLVWGVESQTSMLQEELAELQLELARIPRGRHNEDNILEELVDVYIMCHEFLYIHQEAFVTMLATKLNKFEKAVTKAETNGRFGGTL